MRDTSVVIAAFTTETQRTPSGRGEKRINLCAYSAFSASAAVGFGVPILSVPI